MRIVSMLLIALLGLSILQPKKVTTTQPASQTIEFIYAPCLSSFFVYLTLELFTVYVYVFWGHLLLNSTSKGLEYR